MAVQNPCGAFFADMSARTEQLSMQSQVLVWTVWLTGATKTAFYL